PWTSITVKRKTSTFESASLTASSFVGWITAMISFMRTFGSLEMSGPAMPLGPGWAEARTAGIGARRPARLQPFPPDPPRPSPARHSGQSREHPVAAEVRIAEPLDGVSHAVGQRQQEPVVGHFLVLERAAHAEVQAVADQHERDVVERVRVPLAQLIGP